jgi:hypothetical protein
MSSTRRYRIVASGTDVTAGTDVTMTTEWLTGPDEVLARYGAVRRHMRGRQRPLFRQASVVDEQVGHVLSCYRARVAVVDRPSSGMMARLPAGERAALQRWQTSPPSVRGELVLDRDEVSAWFEPVESATPAGNDEF